VEGGTWVTEEPTRFW